MIRGLHLTTLFALIAILSTTATAEDKVQLKLQFPDGRASTTVVRVKTAQTLKLAGNDLESGADQTISVTSVNGKRAEDGTLSVKSKIEALKAAVTLPGGTELEFDSAKPDADPPGTQFDFVLDIFKATAKSTWESVMDDDDRVIAIKGRDAAFADLPDNLKEAMKSQLDAEYLKTAANDELAKLPSEPVAVDDSWVRKNTVRLDSGQRLAFTNKYTYKGSVKEGNKDVEKILAETTEVEYSADANAPLKVLKSDLKIASSEGVILLDNADGQVVSATNKVRITGTLTLQVMGMEFPGELDLTMENSTTLK